MRAQRDFIRAMETGLLRLSASGRCVSLPGGILRDGRASRKSARRKCKVYKNTKPSSQEPSCSSSINNAALCR